jgi:hypothetical protein
MPLDRLDLPVVVCAPDVDEVLPTASELVAVISEVVGKVRRAALGPDEHAVALVAELARSQPGRAVLVVRVPALAEESQHLGHVTPVVQRALGEPGVEVHADPPEVFPKSFDDASVTPFGRLRHRNAVAQLAVQLAGHLDQVWP